MLILSGMTWSWKPKKPNNSHQSWQYASTDCSRCSQGTILTDCGISLQLLTKDSSPIWSNWRNWQCICLFRLRTVREDSVCKIASIHQSDDKWKIQQTDADSDWGMAHSRLWLCYSPSHLHIYKEQKDIFSSLNKMLLKSSLPQNLKLKICDF